MTSWPFSELFLPFQSFITFNSVTLKNTQREPQKYIIFQQNKSYLESADKIKKILEFFFFFYFLENYSRRVRKSTNKIILA